MKRTQKLHENVYAHLDELYHVACHKEDYAVALKALELCIKHKQQQSKTAINLNDMSDAELQALIDTLDDHQ